MPATFTRTPAHEVERKDPGTGGRPPVDKRPTGGGGGDENWDRHRHGRRGPGELITRYRMALIFGLSGDLMFFRPPAISMHGMITCSIGGRFIFRRSCSSIRQSCCSAR
jgi:hypothetical protein